MSKPVFILIGLVVLACAVLFVASLSTQAGLSVNFDGEESAFALRYNDPGRDSGFFTGVAMEVNDFFSDFGWYQDLNRAYFELGEPLKVLLNWVLGGFWAFLFLGRRR